MAEAGAQPSAHRAERRAFCPVSTFRSETPVVGEGRVVQAFQRERAEQGFAWPYGKPYGSFARLMENRTVRHGQAKLGSVLAGAELPMAVPGGPTSRRCVLMAVLPARSLIPNRLENGSPAAGCLRGTPCVQNHMGFQYGLAKTRTENPQVMVQDGKTHGNCRCGLLLPDELQKS